MRSPNEVTARFNLSLPSPAFGRRRRLRTWSLFCTAAGLLWAFPLLSQGAETDVTPSVQVTKGRLFYDYAKLQTYLQVSLTNRSSQALSSPVRLVIDSVSPATVSVANRDGTTVAGKPYLDFSSNLGNGILSPSERSGEKTLRFSNPKQLRFTFTTRVFADVPSSANRPPVADAAGPYLGNVAQAITFAGSGNDPDGDPLTYAWAFGDGGAAAGASVTHAYVSAGVYTATLTVTDGRGGSANATASVTVVQPNRPPTADAQGPYSGNMGQPITFAGSGGDPDAGDVLAYAWTFGDGGNATGATATHTYAAGGAFTATLTVTDSEGLSATSNAAVTVNRPPAANAGGSYTGNLGQAITFNGSGSDPDDDPLSYSWAFGDGGSATGASVTHAYAAAGPYTATLTVTDGRGGSGMATASVTVIQPNRAPTANASGPYSGTAGQVIAFSGSGSDLDNDPLTYLWAFGDGATAVGASVAHAYAAAGSYTAALTVSDGRGGSATAEAEVAVGPPPQTTLHRPVLSIPQTAFFVDEGGALQIQVSASDQDGDRVTLTASPRLPSSTFVVSAGIAPSGTFVFTPDFDQQGHYAVSFTARDATGLSAGETVNITVNNVNRAPVLQVPPALNVDEGGLLTIPVTASDPDGDPLAFTASALPPNALLIPSTRMVAFTPDYTQAGTYDIAVRATDGQATVEQTVRVTVNDVPIGGPGGPGNLVLTVNEPESPTFLSQTRITGSVNASPPVVARLRSALITGANPASGTQGSTFDVALTGTASGTYATHFQSGISQASFGKGVSVNSLTVSSPTAATANVTIEASAEPGPRTVTVMTGNETALGVVAFDVTAGQTAVSGILRDPETGQAIAGATVTLQGTGVQTTTGSDGSFALAGAPPGNWTLVVNAPNRDLVTLPVVAAVGVAVNVGTLGSKATVFDPTAPAAATLRSVVGRGLPKMIFAGSAEEAKDVIRDAIQTVGGTKFGMLDEFGNQLNPNVSGNGLASLKAEAVDYVAGRWQAGETTSLGAMLLGFVTLVDWQNNDDPPSPVVFVAALQELASQAWSDRNNAEYALPIALFNRGPSISPDPPQLSLETPLNPLQAYLLSVTILGYLNQLFYYQTFPDGTGEVQTGAREVAAPIRLALKTLGEARGGGTLTDVRPSPLFAQQVNMLPVAVAGPSQSVELSGYAGVKVTLDGTGSSDPDGTITAYRWIRTSSDDPDPPDVAQPEITLLPGGGQYHKFRLMVQDNQGAYSAPAEVTITLSGGCGLVNSGNPALISWCQVFQSVGESKIKDAMKDIDETAKSIYSIISPTVVDTAKTKSVVGQKWVDFTKEMGIDTDFVTKKKIRSDFLTEYKELRKAAEQMGEVTRWANGIANLMQDTMDAIVGQMADALFKQLFLKNLVAGYISASRPEPPFLESGQVDHTPGGLPESVKVNFRPSINEVNAAEAGSGSRYYYVVYRQNPGKGGLEVLSILPSYKYYPGLANKNEEDGRRLMREFLKLRGGDLKLSFVDPQPVIGTNTYKIITRVIRGPVPSKPYTPPEQKMVLDILVSRAGPAATALVDAVLTVADTFQDIFIETRYQVSEFSNPAYVYVGAITDNLYPRVDLAVALQTGDLFVSIPDESKILKWSPEGLQDYANPGFKNPFQAGLGCDPWGNLFTDNKASDDRFGGKVFRLDVNGVREVVGSTNYYSDLLQYARGCDVKAVTYGLDRTGTGALYIADTADRRITRLDLRGGKIINNYLTERNVSQNFAVSNQFLFQGNTHLYYSQTMNTVYATQGTELLFAYPDGTVFNPFGLGDSPFGESWLTGIDGDLSGHLYVADMFLGKVTKIPYWYATLDGYGMDPDFLRRYVVVDGLESPLDIRLSPDMRELFVVDGRGLKRIRLGLSGRVWDVQRNLPLASGVILINGQAVGTTDAEGYFHLVNIGETGPVQFRVQSSDGRTQDLSRTARMPYPGEGHIVMENDLLFDPPPLAPPTDAHLDANAQLEVAPPATPQEVEVTVDSQSLGTTIERHFVLPKQTVLPNAALAAQLNLGPLPARPGPPRTSETLAEIDVPLAPKVAAREGQHGLGTIYRVTPRLISPVAGLKVAKLGTSPPRTQIRGTIVVPENYPEAAPALVTLTVNGAQRAVEVRGGRFQTDDVELNDGLNVITVSADPSEIISAGKVLVPGRAALTVPAGVYGQPTTSAPEPPVLAAAQATATGAEPRRSSDEGIGFAGFVVLKPAEGERPAPHSRAVVTVYDANQPAGIEPKLLARAQTDEVGFYSLIVPKEMLADSASPRYPDPTDPGSLPPRSLRVVVDEVRDEVGGQP